MRSVKTPGHDPVRMDPDPPRVGQRLGAAADLDAADTPRVHADQIVDDDRGLAGAGDVAELLRLRGFDSADLDRGLVGVQTPADRRDVRRAVLAHGRDPAQPPFAKIGQFRRLEGAHAVVLRSPAIAATTVAARSRRRRPAGVAVDGAEAVAMAELLV